MPLTMTEHERNEMRRRLEVCERYIALCMQSSNMQWTPARGLYCTQQPSEAVNMILGDCVWNPPQLDKGG